MLFHEPAFIFGFLPVVLAGYLLLRRWCGPTPVIWFLGLASLVFYGWWEPRFVPLIAGSIIGNFLLGRRMRARPGPALLWGGIAANLLLLGLFKYVDFGIGLLNLLPGVDLPLLSIQLPLGISFFTFLQIAYLVDCHRGQTEAEAFSPYFLFVTFFPHLIAGPLVHHSELIPQFHRRVKAAELWENLAVGATIFTIGLFKKTVLAAQMAVWADRVFNGAANGQDPNLIDAWMGALCFTFQIYFDFSGYSDMAIGLSRLFGIRLPVNFDSPYKAVSIIDFWRRWHMTLSRFLRDYLYIPLGGSRCGKLRRHLNLMIVMVLAGLWHGAAWQFLLWGGAHGLMLVANHGWRALHAVILPARSGGWAGAWLGRSLTFLAVICAWVLFRAQDMTVAAAILKGMAGGNGILLPPHYAGLLDGWAARLSAWGVDFAVLPAYGGGMQLLWLGGCLAFVWLLPNTQEIMRHYNPALGFTMPPAGRTLSARLMARLSWRPGVTAGLVIGAAAMIMTFRVLQGRPGEFIYFQF